MGLVAPMLAGPTAVPEALGCWATAPTAEETAGTIGGPSIGAVAAFPVDVPRTILSKSASRNV